jgi:hypothetical protein
MSWIEFGGFALWSYYEVFQSLMMRGAKRRQGSNFKSIAIVFQALSYLVLPCSIEHFKANSNKTTSGHLIQLERALQPT